MACSLKQSCIIEDISTVRKYFFQVEDDDESMDDDDNEDGWNENDWANEWDNETDEQEHMNIEKDAAGESMDNWLQKCHVAFSPTYDLLAIAYADKLVLLTAKSESVPGSRSHSHKYKISTKIEIAEEPEENVTSVICIPLVSLKKTSHGSVDWSCVVVGFSTGYVRIYTETGALLISQMFDESSVMEVKCKTHDPLSSRKGISNLDQPDEVTILYRDALVLLEGFSLFQTLRACRSQLAIAAASGGMTIEPPPLSYKKWRLTGGQNPISSHVSPGILTPDPFDQMRTASILGGYSAEVRGTAPAMSCFVTSGSSPFTGFYYAVENNGQRCITINNEAISIERKSCKSFPNYNRKRSLADPTWDVARKRRKIESTKHGSTQPHLSHVALAVASKLKSALYSSASRWLAWGTGAPQEPAAQQKPKPKIELGAPLGIRCAMSDPLRHGDNILLAPGAHLSSSCLAATTDSFGRVILMDVTRAIAIRMWKGYRDAQIGFMRVFDDAHHRSHKTDRSVTDRVRRHALFLLIYAPRRGLLEVWTCVNGPRVGAFNVSKNARLICPGYGMLGVNTSTLSGTTSYSFQCCLVEANGQVKEVRIPFHLALSDANSKKARDMHLLKKLNLILHSRKRTGEEAVKILLEIRISGMLKQALEKLLHTRKIGSETFRNCIIAIQQRLREGGGLKKAENDLLKYCDAQISLIDLYEAIQKLNNIGHHESCKSAANIEDVSNVDTMCKLLHMTKTEATDALHAVSCFQKSRLMPRVTFDNIDKPSIDVAEFLDCFLLNDGHCKNDDESTQSDIVLHLTEGPKAMKLAAFLFYSSLYGKTSSDDVLFTLQGTIDLPARTILNLLFQHWLLQDTAIVNNLDTCLEKLYNFIESCSKKNISHTELKYSENTDLSQTETERLSNENQNLWRWVRDDVCAVSHSTTAAFFLAIVARAVAITFNTQGVDEKKEDDEWEKMQQGDDVPPPSYQESCTVEANKPRSGDWETLWIDVEKWNLFVHQLEDSMLINTSINLGQTKRKLPAQEDDNQQNMSKDGSKTLESQDNDDVCRNVSVKDLLMNGPGFMAELLSHSVCRLNIPPCALQKREGDVDAPSQNFKEEQRSFINFLHDTLYVKFPYSLAPDCLHSHCFWELMVEWNKEPLEMTKLTAAIEHLRLVQSDPHARHGLSVMAWKTFVSKRYAALAKLAEKVGKAPKDRLCRKEVGISDALMPSFCQSCTDVLQIIADANVDDVPKPANDSTVTSGGAEDPWQSVTGKRSIVDMGRAHAPAHHGLVQHNMHLCFILHAIMLFSLRGVKPLSGLFDRRGNACFALDLASLKPSLPNPSAMELVINKARQQFLMKVISAAVQQLATHVFNKEEQVSTTRVSEQECKHELERWIETSIHMASEFQISVERVKMFHVDALFKNGLDAVGLEACTTISDKEVLSSSLVFIVGQRLSYILQHANPDEGVIMMSRMSPTLSTWISSQDSTLLKKPDVLIEDTLKLSRMILTTMMSENNSLYNIALSLEEVASTMSSR